MDIRIDALTIIGLVMTITGLVLFAWFKGYNEGQSVGFSRGRSLNWRLSASEDHK